MGIILLKTNIPAVDLNTARTGSVDSRKIWADLLTQTGALLPFKIEFLENKGNFIVKTKINLWCRISRIPPIGRSGGRSWGSVAKAVEIF